MIDNFTKNSGFVQSKPLFVFISISATYTRTPKISPKQKIIS